MDKAIYTAMTGASANLQGQAAVAHNLANANTIGFQATLHNLRAMPVQGPGLASRTAAVREDGGVDGSVGARIETGRTLDIALHQERWLAVQAADGGTAYTRAGNLQLTANGQLLTAAGQPVLDGQGAPVAIAPHDSLHVGADGTISIVPQGQPATDVTNIGRLQVVEAPQAQLRRGPDGLMRPADPDAPPPAAAGAVLASGQLEQSNVNTAQTLVRMIELSRQFEMQVRVLQSADENAKSGNSLLSSR